MLELHQVQTDTLHYTKVVTVLAVSPEAACKAASSQSANILNVTYVGMTESGAVESDPPWRWQVINELEANP